MTFNNLSKTPIASRQSRNSRLRWLDALTTQAGFGDRIRRVIENSTAYTSQHCCTQAPGVSGFHMPQFAAKCLGYQLNQVRVSTASSRDDWRGQGLAATFRQFAYDFPAHSEQKADSLLASLKHICSSVVVAKANVCRRRLGCINWAAFAKNEGQKEKPIFTRQRACALCSLLRIAFIGKEPPSLLQNRRSCQAGSRYCPALGHDVPLDPQPGLRIIYRSIEDRAKCTIGSQEYGRAAGLDAAQAQQRAMTVPSSVIDRYSWFNSKLAGCGGRKLPGSVAAFGYRRQPFRFDVQALRQLRRPVILAQRNQVRPRGITYLSSKLAGKPIAEVVFCQEHVTDLLPLCGKGSARLFGYAREMCGTDETSGGLMESVQSAILPEPFAGSR